MARRSILQDEEPTEINLASMIDCIFILLIFFIVTTVFVEETGLRVDKPDAAAPTTPEEDTSVVLEITAEDEILFDGERIRLVDVRRRVQSGVDSETPVVIRAHEKSNHGVFVSVWDAARQGGADTLSFTTQN